MLHILIIQISTLEKHGKIFYTIIVVDITSNTGIGSWFTNIHLFAVLLLFQYAIELYSNVNYMSINIKFYI